MALCFCKADRLPFQFQIEEKSMDNEEELPAVTPFLETALNVNKFIQFRYVRFKHVCCQHRTYLTISVPRKSYEILPDNQLGVYPEFPDFVDDDFEATWKINPLSLQTNDGFEGPPPAQAVDLQSHGPSILGITSILRCCKAAALNSMEFKPGEAPEELLEDRADNEWRALRSLK